MGVCIWIRNRNHGNTSVNNVDLSPLPDLEGLAVFSRVADLGSFARAAHELKLSRPTVSKAVSRLEARLGVPLLHRHSRRLTLTDDGRRVLERARRILAEGRAAEAEAAASADTPSGVVRLTAPMSFGLQQLGPLLPDFLDSYPDVRLDIELSDAQSDLISGGFDLALRIAALPDSSLRARRVCDVPRSIVASPSYLDREGRPVHPIDLERHRGIFYSNSPTPEVWRLHHEAQGDWVVRVPGRLQANNADVVVPALVAGAGLAIQPLFAIRKEMEAGRLEAVLPEWSLPPVSLYLVTPPGRLRARAVEALIGFLVERLGCPEA